MDLQREIATQTCATINTRNFKCQTGESGHWEKIGKNMEKSINTQKWEGTRNQRRTTTNTTHRSIQTQSIVMKDKATQADKIFWEVHPIESNEIPSEEAVFEKYLAKMREGMTVPTILSPIREVAPSPRRPTLPTVDKVVRDYNDNIDLDIGTWMVGEFHWPAHLN